MNWRCGALRPDSRGCSTRRVIQAAPVKLYHAEQMLRAIVIDLRTKQTKREQTAKAQGQVPAAPSPHLDDHLPECALGKMLVSFTRLLKRIHLVDDRADIVLVEELIHPVER